jgi:uncharacterized membrane protein YeaQ/YmgE (transglycosylase-associated protein family)
MDYFAKLCIGIVTGLLVYFLYPISKQARPLTAAAFGLVGGAIGAFLSERIYSLGGAYLTPASLATVVVTSGVFVLAYLTISS